MQTLDIVVENPRGLHMRVATEIVRIAREYGVSVRISRDGKRTADGRSVLELLLLDAAEGSTLHIAVDGRDAAHAVLQIGELFSDGSGI